MFKNYFKIAWRNIKRNKLHATIHIMGLAVAFSICTLLFLIAYFHLSFDSFHEDKSRLFKVSRFENNVQGPEITTNMPLPLSRALKSDIGDVEFAVVVNKERPENFSYQDKDLSRVITRTEPGFFDLFNFPIIKGDSKAALSDLQNIVLAESTAKDIFGETDPIGKRLKIGKAGEEQFYIVSAIAKDAPKNSSIHFDAIARIESLNGYDTKKDRWNANSSNVFVKILEKSNLPLVESKLSPFVEKYYPDQLERLKQEHPETKETDELLNLKLINIEDIHFGRRGAPKALIYAIMSLGAFILLIACFNFINLNMAQSFQRSRELGVRKTLGAFKKQLFFQLWGEAFFVYFIGFVMGIAFAAQLLPEVNARFGGGIEISTLLQPSFLAIMGGVFMMVTLIAGGYPALKMSNFRLVEILKGNVSAKKPGTLRNSLLVGQFAISTLLICISFIAAQQLNFLKQKPIGFEKQQVVSIPVGNQSDGRKVLDRLRNELASDPAVISLAGSGSNLGRGRDRTTSRSIIGIEYNENQIQADELLVDFDYLKTLQIPIVKGRDFSKRFGTDTTNMAVVTESFVKAMGETDPIGKYFGDDDETSRSKIIGVIPDFNAHSPSEKSLPIVLHLSADQAINYIFVKVKSNDPEIVLNRLETTWEKVTGNVDFNASFLDENLQAWYEMESTLTGVFTIASTIAIFLSCLGLFAISLMLIELRTKEIGIRKVMGASIKNIVSMISLHFLKLVFIGLLIAIPLAWYAMQNWIQGYEYRIEINPLTFIGVGFLVAFIALLTVSFHSIKAALANPVKSLRSE
ncbi:FtsX-like permease family protein [Maribacter sp. 2307UL18-2]|uniref:ABC transporter permease n=1 Tax=Maribacter sp. 2307UL18-2 TaxID=3386274 RepID=UPI0039BC4D42